MTKEGSIHKMAREIYSFLEEKYADRDLSTRDIRRGLRETIDKFELYELLYGIKETDSLVYFPFEKGYKESIFPEPEKRKRRKSKRLHSRRVS